MITVELLDVPAVVRQLRVINQQLPNQREKRSVRNVFSLEFRVWRARVVAYLDFCASNLEATS